MKTNSIVAALLAAILPPLSEGAGAAVAVTFVEPEKYADMPYSAFDKERVLLNLREHFDKLGAALPAGQDLNVEILDIDLAGRIEPTMRTSYDLRILRGTADWPSITLRYTLVFQGKTLKSGEERIADMTYLQGYNRYFSGEYLRYEKQMLDRWFQKTFVAPKAGS